MKLYYKQPECKEDYDKCQRNEDKRHDDYDDRRCDYDDRRCDFDDRCCDRHKYAYCYPKNPCPYPVLFECATGTGTEISRTIPDSVPTYNFFAPRSLGCLTIDTSCLKNPVVKFDFCTTIKFKSAGDQDNPVRLTFQLFKTCGDRQEIPCGTWDYIAAFSTEKEQSTTSFCFSHCECNSCPGCCTYTVKITEAVNIVNGDILCVYCPTLSAIAKSGC